MIGIKESAKVNNLIVILKVAVVLLFIIFGLQYVNPENWKPFIPPNTGDCGDVRLGGVFRGAGLVFFAYIGFDAVSTAAQEAKNPQKDMPIGILGSLAICTCCTLSCPLTLTGMVPLRPAQCCRIRWRSPWRGSAQLLAPPFITWARCWAWARSSW